VHGNRPVTQLRQAELRHAVVDRSPLWSRRYADVSGVDQSPDGSWAGPRRCFLWVIGGYAQRVMV